MPTILEEAPLYLGKLNEADADITYAPYQDRGFIDASFRTEGIVETLGFRVTENTGALGWVVKISPGSAVIQGDGGTNRGKYLVRLYDEITLITPTPAASNRVHRVVLRVRDNQFDASGFSDAVLDVIVGESSSAPAIPDSAISLATLTVNASGQAAIQTAMITDTRIFTGSSFPMFINRSSVATTMTAQSVFYGVKFNNAYSMAAAGVEHTSGTSVFKVMRSGWYQLTGQYSVASVSNLDGNGLGYGAAYPLNTLTKYPLAHAHGGNQNQNNPYSYLAGIPSVTMFGRWQINGALQGVENSVPWYSEHAFVTVQMPNYMVYLNAGSTIEMMCYSSEVAGLVTEIGNSALQPWIQAVWMTGGSGLGF